VKPVTALPALHDGAPAAERGRLREAAEAFEALLVQYVFRAMREAQLEQGFFGERAGASIYEAMFEDRLARVLSEGSPFGVAAALEARWLDGAGSTEPRLPDTAPGIQVFRVLADEELRRSMGSGDPGGAP
jgi:Rod binding domain-containing protein